MDARQSKYLTTTHSIGTIPASNALMPGLTGRDVEEGKQI
jgi:hypothetical protein